MKTPRELSTLKNSEIDLTDYGYNFAFIINGKVEYISGTNELFARILIDSDKIVQIEKDQYDVGSTYTE
ncbi:hypothetical protein EB001_14090 [bacterium]|nr:hypothetical protein [bacterium]